jgi:prevent-host-death family protein
MGDPIVSKTVNVLEAKNKLTQLLRQVERGTDVTITKHGEPTAMLISVKAYERLRRQAAASRLRELREELADSGLDAQEIYRESRKQLEARS